MKKLLASLLLSACGGAPFVEAAHTPQPQIAKHEGVVIDAGQLVTITFPGYEYTSQAQAFADFIGGSSWLKTVGAEYGVGPATSKQKVVWPTAAPANAADSDLRKLLAQGMMDGTLPVPSGSKNELAFIVYWPSTSILDASDDEAGVLCMRAAAHSAGDPFGLGYHDSLLAPDGVTLVPYIVVGDCGDGIDEVTTTASRGVIGAFTNPYETNNSGWLLDVSLPDPWYADINNGEVDYMCEREKAVQEGGFALHRSWSNAAAAASNQPCVPSPEGTSYFNVSASPSTVPTVAAGTTLTFTITGWSNEKVAAWPMLVLAASGSDLSLEDMNPTLDDYTGQNGKTVTLTVQVPKTAQSSQLGGVNIMSGATQHEWPVAFNVK